MAKGIRPTLTKILLCVLTLSLAGCGSARQSASSGSQGNPVTITFAAAYGPASQYESLIAEFEAGHPQIHVQLLDLGANQPGLEGLVAQADTILLGSAIPWSGGQMLLDLSPLMVSAGLDAQGYWPGALAGCQSDETQEGLPVHLSPTAILFNKDAFDQAGLVYPKPGWTWDEFEAAARALSAPDAEPPRYGFYAAKAGSLLNPLIDATLAAGGDRVELVSNLQWYIDLVRQGGAAGLKQEEVSGLIRDGRLAMWLGDLPGAAHEGSGLDFDVGVAPFPLSAGTQETNPVSLTCAGISAGTRQPAASWKWLKFLSQNLPSFDDSLPAWVAAAESGSTWGQLSAEQAESALFALEHGWYGWVKYDFSTVGEALAEAIQTGDDLASLLPGDLSRQAVQAAIPTLQQTLVAVAPPATPTQAAKAVPADVQSAVYFVDPDYHASREAVRALAKAFNSTHSDVFIQTATERPGFDSGSYAMFDVDHFDCFASPGGAIFDEGFTGKVYPLDPLLDAAGESLLDELDPTLLDGVRLDGALYGLPVALRPYVVYYNASLLKELGLEPPAPDWTVEDFWILATQAAASEAGLYGYTPIPFNWTSPFYFLSSARYLDTTQDWLEASYDDPEVIGLLDRLAPLARAWVLYPIDGGGTRTPLGNLPESQQQVENGNAALWVNQAGMRWGIWEVDQGSNHPPLFEMEVGVAPFPMDQAMNPADPTLLYISRRAQNPQACWEWFKFLADLPVNVFQGIPLRRSILESEAWAASVGPERAEAYRATMPSLRISTQSETLIPAPFLQWWSDALAAVLQEGQDASSVLRAIQFKAQATLDCMQAAGISSFKPSEELYNTADSCAHAADSDYLNQLELFKLQGELENTGK